MIKFSIFLSSCSDDLSVWQQPILSGEIESHCKTCDRACFQLSCVCLLVQGESHNIITCVAIVVLPTPRNHNLITTHYAPSLFVQLMLATLKVLGQRIKQSCGDIHPGVFCQLSRSLLSMIGAYW